MDRYYIYEKSDHVQIGPKPVTTLIACTETTKRHSVPGVVDAKIEAIKKD